MTAESISAEGEAPQCEGAVRPLQPQLLSQRNHGTESQSRNWDGGQRKIISDLMKKEPVPYWSSLCASFYRHKEQEEKIEVEVEKQRESPLNSQQEESCTGGTEGGITAKILSDPASIEARGLG